MKKKNSRNTKGKIVSAAWQLFYRQGYDDTTIDEIVEASGTSRGSFYHYFEGKDALLSSLSYLFDEKYEELMETMDTNLSPIEKLIFLNQELFGMIENTVSVDLLCQLFSSQLITKGEFSNIKNNPIAQSVRFAPTKARVLVLKATRMVNEGDSVAAQRLGVEQF